METNNQDALWEIAKKRVEFKRQITSFFLVNSFLVAIWYITSGRYGGYFWPVWPIIGWGFGVALSYLNAYHDTHFFSTQKEYEKLKNNSKGL